MICIYARPGSTNLIPWHQDLVGFCWLFLWCLRAILAWGLESEDWISMSSGQIIHSDLTRPKTPQRKGMFLISGKARLVQYYSLARCVDYFWDICHCLYFVWKKWMVFWSQQYYNIFFIWPQCHVLFLGKTRSFWCHLQPSRTPIPPMWVLVGRLLKLKKLPNRIQSLCSLANVMNDRWVGAILSEMRSTFYWVLGFFPLLFGGGGGQR